MQRYDQSYFFKITNFDKTASGEEKQSNGIGEVEHNAEESTDACCLSGEGEGAEEK